MLKNTISDHRLTHIRARATTTTASHRLTSVPAPPPKPQAAARSGDRDPSASRQGQREGTPRESKAGGAMPPMPRVPGHPVKYNAPRKPTKSPTELARHRISRPTQHAVEGQEPDRVLRKEGIIRDSLGDHMPAMGIQQPPAIPRREPSPPHLPFTGEYPRLPLTPFLNHFVTAAYFTWLSKAWRLPS